MKKYNKLVRDNIPDIIKADGGKCKTRVAKKDEFEFLLNSKLSEEVHEFFQNPCAEEIADILEVIEALLKLYKIGIDDIKTVKGKKKNEHGGFHQMIVLEKATEQK